MKQYGSYSDADLTDWEHLPLPSKVLTESAFGAWLMRRDEHRDRAMNLISMNELEDIKKNRYNQGFYDGYKKATEQANAVLENIKTEIRHFMFDINPSSSESDYACNYILDIIDKHIAESEVKDADSD